MKTPICGDLATLERTSPIKHSFRVEITAAVVHAYFKHHSKIKLYRRATGNRKQTLLFEGKNGIKTFYRNNTILLNKIAVSLRLLLLLYVLFLDVQTKSYRGSAQQHHKYSRKFTKGNEQVETI